MSTSIPTASSAKRPFENNSEYLPVVDISVGSRFHAFDLARELDRRGMMRTLHTGYPSFTARRFGLRGAIISSVVTHELVNRGQSWLRRMGFTAVSWDAKLSQRFDRIVAGRIKTGANIFVGWSSQCLLSLRAAARVGMITIVERGSTHILWQEQVLREEGDICGLRGEVPGERTLLRELQEYEEANYIAVPSKFVANTFVENGISRERLLVNPYGVDLAHFIPGRRINSDELRVLHVGQVSLRKGVHYLVDAIDQVPGSNVTFVGSVHPGMKNMLNRPRSRVVGPVAGSDLPSFYNDADVFCLLSIEEGLALVLAQAMAMALPVIATPNTGVAELITDGVEGFLVPPRDPDAVAEKLRLLKGDAELRREMGRRARSRIESGFSWNHYGERAVMNYQRILRARSTRA